ncbi:TSUP family transporter, partial [Acinetobacter baumannii]
VSAFGAATAASYAVSGLIDWPMAGLFVLGGLAGGVVGAWIGKVLGARKRALALVFASLVILVGAYVVAKGFSHPSAAA